MRRPAPVVLVALVLALGGCAEASGPGPGAEASADPGVPTASGTRVPPTPLPLPGGSPTPWPTGEVAVPGGTVEAAVADLAEHLGVPREDVSVLRAQPVTWSDGSLGCPQPGHSYTQAQVEGARIELGVGGSTYRYHAGGDRAPFRCETPGIPPATEH